MDKRQLAEKLIANFGAMLTLPELRLDDKSHSCVLLFDGDIVLNIEFDDASAQLILSAYLDELSDLYAETTLRELMVANLYWHRTDGATIGLEESTQGLILAQARGVSELDDASFEKLVETFVNQAERWKKRIAALKQGGREDSANSMDLMPARDGAQIFG